MELVLEPIPLPLEIDETGTVRVGRTRIPLDAVIIEYQEGARPEEIVESFPTLNLADVYAVISFYLNNRAAVDAYLHQRELEAAEIRRKWEASYTFDRKNLKEHLLARLRQKEQR